MSTPLTINNNTFNYPSPGDDPGWGENATGWASAVTTAINNLLGPGDIIETTFNIANNISTNTNIVGLLFNPTSVRAAVIEYSMYRRSNTNPSGTVEEGTITLIYDNDASAGNKWKLTREANFDAGIDIDIVDSTGQLVYQSTNIGATGYSGTMKFRARTLSQ